MQGYFGPDRRRRELTSYMVQERRKAAQADNGGEGEKELSQEEVEALFK